MDLTTMFPGDRIVIRGPPSLKPNDRVVAAVVAQPTSSVVVTPRLSTWSSPVALAGVLIVGIVTGAAFAGKRRLSTVIMALTGNADSQLEAKDNEIDALRAHLDVAERDLTDMREKWLRNEQSLENLQQLLESASRADASLRDQISVLKESLDSRNNDVKRLESSNAEANELAEQYKTKLKNAQGEVDALRETERNSASQLAQVTQMTTQYEGDILSYKSKLLDIEAELMALRELNDGYSDEANTSKEKYKETLSEIAKVTGVE
jgi:chromosome segregation ATPase